MAYGDGRFCFTFCHEAQGALRSDEETIEIISCRGLPRSPPGLNDPPIRKHDGQVDYPVFHCAVLNGIGARAVCSNHASYLRTWAYLAWLASAYTLAWLGPASSGTVSLPISANLVVDRREDSPGSTGKNSPLPILFNCSFRSCHPIDGCTTTSISSWLNWTIWSI
jgi:hypothetical protein